jgi:hypothetical protein
MSKTNSNEVTNISAYEEAEDSNTLGEISLDLFGDLQIGLNMKLMAKYYLAKYLEECSKTTKEHALAKINDELQTAGIEMIKTLKSK